MNSLKKDQHNSNTAPSPPAVKNHGLANQGATCYLNSVLQVLFMTEDFREAVGRHSCENPDTEWIDPHLNTLFDDLKQHTAHTYNITKKLGINNVKEQRDAAEYYERILSLTSPNASQIFHGLSTHKTICSSCHTETDIDEAFWHLPLALVDSYSEHYSVLDGIKDYFKTSAFTEENQMYCEQCDAKSDATSKHVMKRHPEVLMLLLKRFEFDDHYMTYVKINRTVDVPFRLQIPENQTYELYAVVDHFGDLISGHYTATIKAKEGWCNFDDARVTSHIYQPFQVDNLEQSRTAYLLFYKKINAHAADTRDTTEESRPEGFTSVTIDISDQHEDDVKKKKKEEGEGEAEAGDDTAVGVSTVSDEHVHLYKNEMSGAQRKKMEGDEQAEKKRKSVKKYSERDAEHQDSEGLNYVKQNIKKDLGGTQQVGQDYDLKLVRVDEEGDGKKIEIDVEEDKEGNTGSKTRKCLTKYDPCSQQSSDSGGVGDSQRDIIRNNQRFGQENSSRCKRLQQQREERGDDKDAQRRETSLRQQHFGRHAEHQGSEGLDDVRQNLKKDLGGTQQVGQDYDLKPVRVDEEGDGKNMEIDGEVGKEGKTGSKTRKLLTKYDLCFQEMSDSGGGGDTHQDVLRNNQRCRQGSSSRCERDEQQRAERGDDKDARRSKTSPRHEHCGQSVEDQNKGSEQRDSVRHTGYKDVGMERLAKEQEKKRDEHIQNRVESSYRLTGSAENQEVSRFENPHPKARNEFTEGRVEGRPGSKTSRPFHLKIIEEETKDGVQGSCEKSYILHKESQKTSLVEYSEGKSGPKTDEHVSLSERVHSLQLSESRLQEPRKHRTKRARIARVEAAERNYALGKRGEKKTRK